MVRVLQFHVSLTIAITIIIIIIIIIISMIKKERENGIEKREMSSRERKVKDVAIVNDAAMLRYVMIFSSKEKTRHTKKQR